MEEREGEREEGGSEGEGAIKWQEEEICTCICGYMYYGITATPTCEPSRYSLDHWHDIG